jgi:hypothetical protein
MSFLKMPPSFEHRIIDLEKKISTLESELQNTISSRIKSIPNKDQLLNLSQNIWNEEISSASQNIIEHISTTTLNGYYELEQQQKNQIENIFDDFIKKQIDKTMSWVQTCCASKNLGSRNYEEHYKASILDIQTRMKNNLDSALATAILINKQRIGTEKEKKAGDRIWQIIYIILGIIIGYFLGKYLKL